MTLTDLERRIIAVILSHFTEFGSVGAIMSKWLKLGHCLRKNVAKIHFPVVYDGDRVRDD